MLIFSTLGTFEVRFHDRPVERVGSGKLAALLAYLATEPGPHHRETLADLFWPALPPAAARLNLRQSVFQLRALLEAATGQPCLDSTRTQVGWQEDVARQVDAHLLRACHTADDGGADVDVLLARLEQATALYRGEFLRGLSVPESINFEDWLQYNRETLLRHVLRLLASQTTLHEERGNLAQAAHCAARAARLDAWNEDKQLRVMRLYSALGRPDLALDHYETCRATLDRDLGVQPKDELRLLAQAMRERLASGEAAAVSTPALPERRHVTVLYCQLARPAVADPELAFAQLRERQAGCELLVARGGGHVVQSHGGGLLAYFGYPSALENAARAALAAAWTLVCQGDRHARVGVYRGLVLTDPGQALPDPLGQTTEQAVRLHHLAAPGEVVFSATLLPYVRDHLRYAPLRPPAGAWPQGDPVYLLQGGHAGAVLPGGAVRRAFVGRTAQLHSLHALWRRALDGRFEAVLVSGEAGVGKSRLANVFRAAVCVPPVMVAELRCFPEQRAAPLWPLIQMLATLCGVTPADDGAARAARLHRFLALHADAAGAWEDGLARLLGLAEAANADHPDASPAGPMLRLLTALAARQPLLLLADDLQWADHSTLAVLQALVARAPARALLLGTARSGWQAGWPQLTELALAPLPGAAVAALASSINPALSGAALARIIARADGLPLFAEELAAMDDGDALPDSLSDLLMARLDALGPAKPLAQVAACLGRTFSAPLLAAASASDPARFEHDLARLLQSQLMQRGADGAIQFKHALVQEAAYESQTRAVRAAHHRRIAQVLEAGPQAQLTPEPETLARHWAGAGDAARAARAWCAAADRANANLAHAEARAHCDAGLALLPGLPELPATRALEIDLLLALARCRQNEAGYGDAEAQATLTRAVTLVRQDRAQAARLFHALWGQWEGASSRAHQQAALHEARRLLDLANSTGERTLRLQAHYAMGASLFWHGAFDAARQHLDEALQLEPPHTQPLTRDAYGHITVCAAHAYLSWVLWIQGAPQPALASSALAVRLARQQDDLLAQAFTLTFAATLRRWQGDLAQARLLAQEAQQAATRAQSQAFQIAAGSTLDWLTVMETRAHTTDAIADKVGAIKRAFDGAVVALQAMQAEALLHLDQPAAARAVLAEAIANAASKHDGHYLAELYRLQGECWRRDGALAAARADFEQALQISERQGAQVFHARAAAALAALPTAVAPSAPAVLAAAPAP